MPTAHRRRSRTRKKKTALLPLPRLRLRWSPRRLRCWRGSTACPWTDAAPPPRLLAAPAALVAVGCVTTTVGRARCPQRHSLLQLSCRSWRVTLLQPSLRPKGTRRSGLARLRTTPRKRVKRMQKRMMRPLLPDALLGMSASQSCWRSSPPPPALMRSLPSSPSSLMC